MANKTDWHHPRPQGADLSKKTFKVQDEKGVVWGTNLTWDQAWKRKEEVAGQRKSTTPRIMPMDAAAPPAATKSNGSGIANQVKSWSDDQRKQAAQAAAASAVAQVPAAVTEPIPPIPEDELVTDIGPEDEAELRELGLLQGSDKVDEALADSNGMNDPGSIPPW